MEYELRIYMDKEKQTEPKIIYDNALSQYLYCPVESDILDLTEVYRLSHIFNPHPTSLEKPYADYIFVGYQ